MNTLKDIDSSLNGNITYQPLFKGPVNQRTRLLQVLIK